MLIIVFQIVFYSLWKNQIWTFDGNTKVSFNRIPEAREWALKSHNKPIKIRIV